jgi:hypothetical protein
MASDDRVGDLDQVYACDAITIEYYWRSWDLQATVMQQDAVRS